MITLSFKDQDYNGVAQKVAQFTGKLVSVAKNMLTNVNGTGYYPATVEITDDNDAKHLRPCIIYQTSFDKGMTVGDSYLGSVVIEAGQQPIIKLSSGTGIADRATLADFGFGEETTSNVETPQADLNSIG